MKSKIAVFAGLVLVAGCSSAPKLSEYEGPKALDRMDVIKGNKDCFDAGLRPNVEYVVKKTDSGKVLVPINVHCEPYPSKGFLGYPEKK
jgi:hypothetical protein